MSNTVNIFKTLPVPASDSEDEHQTVEVPSKKNDKKKQTQNDNKKGNKEPETKNQQAKQGKTVPAEGTVQKESRDYHNHKKEFHKQQKDDLEHPHPNDRHSGSGVHAYGNKPKKEGAGKANWGTNKEEPKANEEGETVEETKNETTEKKDEKPVEKPVEKEGVTLEEYYAKIKRVENQVQINEAKAKITKDQLMKEMGTATLLKNRAQQQVDDRKAGKKKERLDVDHHAAITTENANLLSFKTGFIEKEFKPRDPADRKVPRERKYRGDNEEVKEKAEVQTEQATDNQNKEADNAGDDYYKNRRQNNRNNDEAGNSYYKNRNNDEAGNSYYKNRNNDESGNNYYKNRNNDESGNNYYKNRRQNDRGNEEGGNNYYKNRRQQRDRNDNAGTGDVVYYQKKGAEGEQQEVQPQEGETKPVEEQGQEEQRGQGQRRGGPRRYPQGDRNAERGEKTGPRKEYGERKDYGERRHGPRKPYDQV